MKLVQYSLVTISPTRFVIYFDSLETQDMQFLESICISYMDVDHLEIILNHLLGSLVLPTLVPYFWDN